VNSLEEKDIARIAGRVGPLFDWVEVPGGESKVECVHVADAIEIKLVAKKKSQSAQRSQQKPLSKPPALWITQQGEEVERALRGGLCV